MDDPETLNRRLRLAELVNACFNGEQVGLLRHIRERTGKAPNQGEISSLIKPNNPARSFGDKKAKTLTEQIGLHRRWFDFPPGTNLERESWASEVASPESKSNAITAPAEAKGGLSAFSRTTSTRFLPHDPDVITRENIRIMGTEALPQEFRLVSEHDLIGEAGELSLPKGHFAVMDSTVAHRMRDIVLVEFPDGSVDLRRVIRGEDGRTYLMGAGVVAPMTPDHHVRAVAVGASTPRLARPKKR